MGGKVYYGSVQCAPYVLVIFELQPGKRVQCSIRQAQAHLHEAQQQKKLRSSEGRRRKTTLNGGGLAEPLAQNPSTADQAS